MSYEHALPDGTVIKVVPESDIMAIKAGAEREKTEFQTRVDDVQTQLATANTTIAETNRASDETRTNLLKAEAAKEQLEVQIKEGVTSKAQVEELQTKLTAAEGAVSNLNTKLLDQRRLTISNAYSVGVDTLAGKTPEQLDAMEEALKLVDNKKPPTVDVGGGVTSPAVPYSGFEQCKEEIAGLRKGG